MTNFLPNATVLSSYTLGLDGLGNHTNSVEIQALTPIIPNETTSYTHDNANRLTAVNGAVVAHDNNGNLTAWGADTFRYDAEDRLTNSTVAGVSGVCRYDGLGNRLSYATNEVERQFVLDRAASLTQVLAETDASGNIIAYCVYGLGLIQKITPDNTVTQYQFDLRGSTGALTDGSGNITDSYAYDTFGKVANSDGTTVNHFLYLGRYGILDDGNGLSYARARYFSSHVSRFLTLDPFTGEDGDNQSLNRYIYALNNPLAFKDISGLSPGVNGDGSGKTEDTRFTILLRRDSPTSSDSPEGRFHQSC